MTDKKPILAVVIPAYKAEKSINVVLKKIPHEVDFVIVVDDKSPDGLVDEVLKSSDPRVSLLSNKDNRGVGGAVLIGYAYALTRGADIIVKVDSDDQMDLEYLEDLLNPLIERKADYAKGNRFLCPEELHRMPFIRRVGNLGLSFFTKLATGYWQIFDPTNGYTAITREVLQNIEPKRISKSYFFETSMLAELHRMDAVVEDVSIPAIYNDNGSSIMIFREFLLFTGSILKSIVDRIFTQYFKYNFSAVSFFLSSSFVLGLFGIIWGLDKWIKSVRTGIPATTGTVLIAVLPIILGVQFFVQAAALDITNLPKKPISNRKKRISRKGIPLATYYEEQVNSGEVIVRRE